MTVIVLTTSECLVCLFFFFKQKTAYEMRISDWSSDVCSSDLIQNSLDAVSLYLDGKDADPPASIETEGELAALAYPLRQMVKAAQLIRQEKIGRASCRERVCQYV